MKVFRYPRGHDAGKTVTVKELRDFLENYPYDRPVIASWEGVWAYVDTTKCVVEEVTKGHGDDACDCLVFDVNTH